MLNSKEQSVTEKWKVKKADNEFQVMFSGLFVFYKSFLSSQDNAVCNFHPSCSVFAIHSIQEKGALIGMLSAFDRLSRCNGYNQKDYVRRKDNFLLDDPVF
ncbi:MAG: membrane protein insertion efficiency factor YidD [Bacteroidia bacterium]